MITFGNLMYMARNKAGLTLEVASKRVGSHKGYLSGIENEKVNAPSIKMVERLFKLYRPTFKRMIRVAVSVEDLAELAYVSKAPVIVRERLFAAIKKNPLSISISVKCPVCGGRP